MGLCVVFAFPSSMFLCFLRLFLMLQCLSNVWCLFFRCFSLHQFSSQHVLTAVLRVVFVHWMLFMFFNADGPSRKTDILLQGVQSESVHLYTCIILYVSSCCRPISSRSRLHLPNLFRTLFWHIQVPPVHHAKVIWFSHPFAHFCP